MKYLALLSSMLTLLLATSITHGATPSEADVKSLLARIKSSHRVLWPDGAEAQVKAKIAADPNLAFVWNSIKHDADHMLTEEPVKRELIGKRLLDKSRTAERRLMLLGMAWRLTRDQRYAQRAAKEMEAVAAFSDWHPDHFLDVAEMTAGMAIGLDWCRDALTADQIATFGRAIIEKGINPSFAQKYFWVDGTNNWNQVCNGGETLGALAIADVDPDLAAKTIVRAIHSLPYVMDHYAPDGAYPEGAGYWGYGTTFNVIMITALQSALGTDFDLSNRPGFLKTGSYMLNVVGPTHLIFNYSDSGRPKSAAPEPAQFFFANQTGDQSLTYNDRIALDLLRKSPRDAPANADQYAPLLLLWAQPAAHVEQPKSLQYIAHGITPIAAFRSAWDDDASFAAIKGGSASTSHAHMDAGTFVVDALGERWVDSLGMQAYESLEHVHVDLWNMKQESQRWQVFRIGPMSQNVLTVDDQLQQVAGSAPIIRSTSTSAILDLASVYANQLSAIKRGIRLNPGGSITVRDEITAADKPVTVRFAFVTRAAVELGPDGAILKLNGKSLSLHVTGISGLKMETYSTVGPQSFDAPNPGTRLVGFKVHLPANQSAGWDVHFVPDGQPLPTRDEPLAGW